jgi:hypothetical protein
LKLRGEDNRISASLTYDGNTSLLRLFYTLYYDGYNSSTVGGSPWYANYIELDPREGIAFHCYKEKRRVELNGGALIFYDIDGTDLRLIKEYTI